MARPIKETPILYGDEARKFELQVQHPEKLSAEKTAKIMNDYKFMRSRCLNCAF